MEETKCIILDFDGTLGDTKGIILRTMLSTITEMKLPPRTETQCARTIGLPLVQCFTNLYPDHPQTVVTPEMGEQCAAVYRRLFDIFNTPGCVPLFPGVVDTLQSLHQRGLCLTVASSRSHATLDAYIEQLGLGRYIRYIIGVEDVADAKPGPGPVLRTMRDLGFQANECLVVGDTKYDIIMAHNAGVKAVGVTYGNGSRQEIEESGAEWIIDRFADLLNI